MVLGRLPLYGELEASPDCSQASSLSAEEIVVVYHERTKHHYHRFAASVGYMDWATQPDPFRCYEGASLVRLPFPAPRLKLVGDEHSERVQDCKHRTQ